jgi:outer membrane protein OmpA-like peptidoglycan-associated protein
MGADRLRRGRGLPEPAAGRTDTDDERGARDTDVDTLTPDGRDALRTVARTLRELGIDHLRVEGHTDTIGPAAYNRKLSQRRAESVARELARAGISDDAIERVGFGHRKPAADNATAEGRAQNRRVVITVRAD